MIQRKDYLGIIGNGKTCALIDPNLSVCWFCPGRFDDFPLFARALDPARGGSWDLVVLAGTQLASGTQSYLPRTNVLQTRMEGAEAQVLVTDFMPWGKSILIRQIELDNQGLAPRDFTIQASFNPVQSSLCTIQTELVGEVFVAEIRLKGDALRYLTEGQSGQIWVALGADTPVHLVSKSRLEGLISIEPGKKGRVNLALSYGATRGEALSALQSALLQASLLLKEEEAFWHGWLRQARPFKGSLAKLGLEEAYYRSLLALKLLTYEETGAIIAAPTASFPATPGGWENWDYRYSWLRDGYYVAVALDRAGFQCESRRFWDYVATLQDEDGSWAQPLYTVSGANPQEYIVPDLTGPGGERPIRIGNKAADQLQLDNTGNILDGIWQHYTCTKNLSFLESWWPKVSRAADWVAAHWSQVEHGIWEIREEQVHWVHGKVMSATALKSAAKIARTLGYMEQGERWIQVASQIVDQVISRGWSERRSAYLRHYGEEAPLDISVLALEFYGLLDPHDPRLVLTIEEMEKPLSEGGLVIAGGIARYEGAKVPFYLPTLWLARYYIHAGNRQRALELIRICLDSATSLLLMAEHFDPLTWSQWGNFPQAFSHEELIQTLLDYQD